MITHIQGKLVEKTSTNVVIEAHGVGYDINISLNTYSKIPEGEQLKLYTHLQVKEDSHTLYGFYEKKEREIFRLLISVSGIGASIARLILSAMTAEQVQQAIASEDVAAIKSVKGIGVKTAQRTVIELKDKILKTYTIDEDSLQESSHCQIKEQSILALEVLGFSRKQSDKVIDNILREMPNIALEEVIKKALKGLLKHLAQDIKNTRLL